MKMKCCKHDCVGDTRVLDSRLVDLHMIKRRRVCKKCGARFTTYETRIVPQMGYYAEGKEI